MFGNKAAAAVRARPQLFRHAWPSYEYTQSFQGQSWSSSLCLCTSYQRDYHLYRGARNKGSTHLLYPTRCLRFSSATHVINERRDESTIESGVNRADAKSRSDLEGDLLQETTSLVRLLDPSENADEEHSRLLSQIKFEEIDRALEAWSRVAAESKQDDGLEAASQAEALLVALEHNMESSRVIGKELIPDAVIYNKVLHAYAVCKGGMQAAERAQSILERMIAKCREFRAEDNQTTGRVKPPEPTARSFNIVINAWAKSGEQDSGRRAEEIFARMEGWWRECQDKYQSTYFGAAPNARSLSGVMDAWAQSKSEEVAERVMVILEHAIERRREQVLSEKGVGDIVEGTVIKPNVIMFNSAIHAWVNSAQGVYGAKKSEEILAMLEHLKESKELGEVDENDEDDVGLAPNTRTLSLVLDAWAQCEDSSGEAATRAQLILDRMEKLYHEGHDVKPNYVSFTTCITAWSRSRGVHDAAQRAEALLLRMMELYESTGDEDLRPTLHSGNAVITAWARNSDRNSARRSEAVLEKLETFTRPDTYSYNSVIDAYAKKGDARSAMNILQKMELASKNGTEELQPDVITYNSVLNAFAKSRSNRQAAAIKAEALLGRMEAIYRSGRSNFQPDLRSYTTVIDSWARSNDPWQGTNAYKVLKRMIDQYKAGNENAMPDVFAFTRVIHACGTTHWKNQQQRRSALTTALRAFEELQQSPQFGKPEPRTFGTLLMACGRLASNYRECGQLSAAVFKQCCDAGKVNRAILEQAKHVIPRNLRMNVLGLEDGPVPDEWSRNVETLERSFSIETDQAASTKL